VRLVYVTEKLIFEGWFGPPLRKLYDEGRLLMMAVDEAHLVVEWTQSAFRSRYGDIGSFRQQALPRLPLMALSAVPTPQMWQAVQRSLGIELAATRTTSSICRSNLVLKAR
jgi:superfamily II DNA helicase RecQ